MGKLKTPLWVRKGYITMDEMIIAKSSLSRETLDSLRSDAKTNFKARVILEEVEKNYKRTDHGNNDSNI